MSQNKKVISSVLKRSSKCGKMKIHLIYAVVFAAFQNNLVFIHYFLPAMQLTDKLKRFQLRSISDWHKLRGDKLSRIDILKILFISEDIVMGSTKLTKIEFETQMFLAGVKSKKFIEDIEPIAWEDIRNVLRCLTKKYKNDLKDGYLDNFNIFLEEARDLWKCYF